MWSRKLDPMIDQTVVNSVDKLFGISHKGSMPILAHLSRMLIGELIVYQSSRRLSVCLLVCL